jgi:PAS domain S-box-containing protein
MEDLIKILLIEDDNDLRETTKEFLVVEGFDVFAAGNGATGIQLAIQYQPNAIICDINMPGLSGYEVFNMLQQVTTTSVIPFIFLSAKSSKEDILTGLHLGANDYITKPFEMAQLLEVINRRISHSRKIIEQHDEKFNVLFKNTHTGAFVLNRDTFEYVNASFTTLTGYNHNELIGNSLTNIVHKDSLAQILKILEQCKDGIKKTFEFTVTTITKDKTEKKLNLKGSQAVFKGENRIICTISEDDITKDEASCSSNKNQANNKGKVQPFVKLSEREIEVLKLVCQGYSNIEIADKLFLSERTVEGHRARLFGKTETKNAVALAMWAVKNRIVEI